MDDMHLSYLERFYRLDQRVSVEPCVLKRLSPDERTHFFNMVRGLNPELYRPSVALLSRLDFHAGDAALLDMAHDLALWLLIWHLTTRTSITPIMRTRFSKPPADVARCAFYWSTSQNMSPRTHVWSKSVI